MAMPDASPAIDPALVADEENVQLANLLYGGLVRLDSHYRPVPASAQRWTVSPDHRTYTFYLRPGLRFSNGDRVTADDFQYAITRSLNPALKSPSAPTYLLDIQGAADVLAGKDRSVSGIKVINDRTLSITARWPVPYFLTELTYPTSFALDKKRLSKLGSVENTSWYSSPIGSGPYKLKSWIPNSQMILVPNPYFPEAKQAIKRIEISLSPLPVSSLYQYVSSKLDVTPLPSNIPSLRRESGVRETQMLAIDGVYFNLHARPFNNKNVRLALLTSLPRSRVVEKYMGKTVTAFSGDVPPGEAGYDPKLKQYSYNVQTARKALAAAGYSDVKTFPQTTLYYADDTSLGKLATAIARTWQKNLGITVNTQALTLNTLLSKVQGGSLPLYIGGWSADYPDPHDWLSLQWASGQVNNNVHYSNATFDRLVETADVTWDYTQRMRLYDEAQQMLVNDVAWMPLYIPHRFEYIRPSVSNLFVTGYGIIPSRGDWASVRVSQTTSNGATHRSLGGGYARHG